MDVLNVFVLYTVFNADPDQTFHFMAKTEFPYGREKSAILPAGSIKPPPKMYTIAFRIRQNTVLPQHFLLKKIL